MRLNVCHKRIKESNFTNSYRILRKRTQKPTFNYHIANYICFKFGVISKNTTSSEMLNLHIPLSYILAIT